MLNLFQYFMILPTGREFCPIQPPSVLFAGWKTLSMYSNLPFDWKQKLSLQFNNSGILADWKTRQNILQENQDTTSVSDEMNGKEIDHQDYISGLPADWKDNCPYRLIQRSYCRLANKD